MDSCNNFFSETTSGDQYFHLTNIKDCNLNVTKKTEGRATKIFANVRNFMTKKRDTIFGTSNIWRQADEHLRFPAGVGMLSLLRLNLIFCLLVPHQLGIHPSNRFEQNQMQIRRPGNYWIFSATKIFEKKWKN